MLRDLRALPKPPIIGLLTGNIRSARKSSAHFGLWNSSSRVSADDHEERDLIAAAAHDRSHRVLAGGCAAKKWSWWATRV